MLSKITVSVIQHRLEAIVQEMGEAMLRTSYSQILNSSRDFSTSLFDGEGRLAAQAEHIPIHVGALPWAVRAVRDFFGERIRPGDMFVLNDPYHGGNHLPDVTVLLPVFLEGRIGFWSVNRAHHSDIGGATHGGYNPAATEVWQEGLRISPLRLYDAGRECDDVLHMLATNVRHSRDFLGDLRAMMGSTRVGERQLRRLVDEYGLATVSAAMGEILDAAERQARACIAEWEDGTFTGESVLDDDGHGTLDVRICARVTKRGDGVTVDLTESDPQTRGFVNSSYPNTMSAVHMAVAYLIDAAIPKNEGTFRPIRVEVKEGTVVWPRPPAPTTLCTQHCGQEIAESVIKALSRSCPARAVAGWSRRFRVAIKGVDPRSGRPFIWHMFHGRGGGGASAESDGWPLAGGLVTGGGVKFGSVEVTEARFPLFFQRYEFRPGSGGPGRHRGGHGAIVDLRVESAGPASANTAGDGVRHAPYGLFGGGEGLPHRCRLVSGGKTRDLRPKEVGVPILPGDLLVVESSGGGGYGRPRERDPLVHAADVRDGLVAAGPARGSARPRPRAGARRGGA